MLHHHSPSYNVIFWTAKYSFKQGYIIYDIYGHFLHDLIIQHNPDLKTFLLVLLFMKKKMPYLKTCFFEDIPPLSKS